MESFKLYCRFAYDVFLHCYGKYIYTLNADQSHSEAEVLTTVLSECLSVDILCIGMCGGLVNQ